MPTFRFDPSKGFESIGRKMSEIAGDIESGIDFEIGGYTPRVDINEDDNGVYFFAELPGVKKENVKVSVSVDNVLTIKGEKFQEDENKERDHVRSERKFGNFKRSFMLPDNVSKESIKANFQDSVLRIQLEKAEPEKPKEYEVNIS